MAAYDVPTELDGVLPWEWAESRLVAARNYWVTTVSGAGRPHSLPVWGVWLPARQRFWFSCAVDSRKRRNLAANPAIVIAPEDTVEVVSVEGIATPVDVAASADAIAAYLAKYWDDPAEHEGMEEFLEANAMFEVRPERAFGIIERPEDFSARATRWVW